MRRQTFVGTTLAIAIIAGWLMLHVYGVFFARLRGSDLTFAPVLVGLLCWLDVGLFIIAHDAMHGSLAPGRPQTNLWFGRIALGLYAGFRFEGLKENHFAHHREPGSGTDPDFSTGHPRDLLPWYFEFMRRYFGVREFLTLCVPVGIYLVIGARLQNILLFWALPAALSSFQLFYFGTFLPHRHGETPFADRHHARSNEFGTIASLFTCFHFGYHHEHHLTPHTPWWQLPIERRLRRQALANSLTQPPRRQR